MASEKESSLKLWTTHVGVPRSIHRLPPLTRGNASYCGFQAYLGCTPTITAFDAGEPAQGGHAMDLAEEARQLIDRWFYDCSPRQHRDLGDLYVGDPRYTASYDQYRPGLARWLRTAIHANADRQQHATGHLPAHAGHQTRGVRVGAPTL